MVARPSVWTLLFLSLPICHPHIPKPVCLQEVDGTASPKWADSVNPAFCCACSGAPWVQSGAGRCLNAVSKPQGAPLTGCVCSRGGGAGVQVSSGATGVLSGMLGSTDVAGRLALVPSRVTVCTPNSVASVAGPVSVPGPCHRTVHGCQVVTLTPGVLFICEPGEGWVTVFTLHILGSRLTFWGPGPRNSSVPVCTEPLAPSVFVCVSGGFLLPL